MPSVVDPVMVRLLLHLLETVIVSDSVCSPTALACALLPARTRVVLQEGGANLK